MSNRQEVALSDIPDKGSDLEDYTAALFQASGYFVEKNLTERDGGDVVEVDVVAAQYHNSAPVRVLGEAKGGDWGYPDLFKVAGWIRYLDLPSAKVFVKSSNKDLERVHKRMLPLGVAVVLLDDFSRASEIFQEAGLGEPVSDELVELWRYSFALEHKLAGLLVSHARQRQSFQCAYDALTYQRLISDGTFFARDSIESLAMLYDAYKEHPRLTLAAAREFDGETYDPRVGNVSSVSLNRALRDGELPYLQACMYVEHRARLAILKFAIDCALEHPERPPLVLVDGEFDWRGFTYSALPSSFKDGMEWLRSQPNFRLYATFWQQFLWGWGGFYLEDRERREFEWMAQHSGLPPGEIQNALKAFDEFFPGVDWLRTIGPTSVRQVALMPALFKGIGAHHRRMQYKLGDDEDAYQRLGSYGYTASDLTFYNNCAVKFLA